MPAMTIIIILALLLCAAGIALCLLLRRNSVLSDQIRNLSVEKARAEERLAAMEQRLRDGSSDRERISALASDALRLNSQSLTEQNKAQIGELLAPIRDSLENFRKAYTDSYGRESEKRAMLEQQIKELSDLNRLIGNEARDLGNALKGNTSIQGQWGEMILENILERSGLTKGRDYIVQKAVDSADSNARPDVIIRCPGGRNIVVDSKVSLSDYMRMTSAPDRQSAKSYGASHVASVKKHIGELRRKNYQDLLSGEKPDFVMMFIPHEGAYLSAMQLDETLWQTAFDSRVVIVSPTHLLSVVRLVEQLWRQDKQERNAIEIAETGSKMLEKLANFISDMDKLKSSLDSAQRAYENAMTKFEGRGGIRSLGEIMHDKGIKVSKGLPSRRVSADGDM